jgi:hypothetical protein
MQQCTLDRVMGLGVYTPIPTFLVDNVGAVLIRAIRASTDGWKHRRRHDWKDAGLWVEVASASWSKKELSFDSSSLTEVRDESTLGFHSRNDLSNVAAVDSSEATHSSRRRSACSNSKRRLLTMDSCVMKPSQISSYTCFMNSSNNILTLGSIAPSFFYRRVK